MLCSGVLLMRRSHLLHNFLEDTFQHRFVLFVDDIFIFRWFGVL